MKKLLSLALIVMVCCSAAIMFGCSSKEGTITINPTTITCAKFTGDEVDYSTAVETELKKITVVVKDKDGEELFNNKLDVARANGASIMGFSLRHDGTFTAKVTMYGLTTEFTYTVGTTAQNPET